MIIILFSITFSNKNELIILYNLIDPENLHNDSNSIFYYAYYILIYILCERVVSIDKS